MTVLNSWQNVAGQTVIETATGLHVAPKGWTVAQWQAAQDSRERGRQAAEAAPAAEQMFAMPEPYYAASLLPEELAALRKEQKQLQATVDDLTVPVVERMRAESRLRAVTVLIERHEASRQRLDTRM